MIIPEELINRLMKDGFVISIGENGKCDVRKIDNGLCPIDFSIVCGDDVEGFANNILRAYYDFNVDHMAQILNCMRPDVPLGAHIVQAEQVEDAILQFWQIIRDYIDEKEK